MTYDYDYPVGMLLPNRYGSFDSYRYGFQGQKKDDEIKEEGNAVSFELRVLDPRIGRWFAVDPYRQCASPYLRIGNNPISMIDSDGGKALWFQIKIWVI